MKHLFYTNTHKIRWQWQAVILLFSFFLFSGLSAILLIPLFEKAVGSVHTGNSLYIFDVLSNLLISALLLGLFCLLNKVKPNKMGLLFSKKTFGHFGFGLLTGIVGIALLAFILIITGDLSIVAIHHPKTLFITFLFFVSVSILEEFITRGALQHAMQLADKPIWGILFPSLFFGLIHLGNSSVTFLAILNTIIIGIVLALITFTTKNLLFALGFHLTWNFFLSIVFGMSVSGTDFPGHQIMETTLLRTSIWNGGAYGVEGGLYFTLLSLLVLSIQLIFIYKKRLAK